MTMENPVESIDALIDPSPLTLGQIALLERIDSPLLRGDVGSMSRCAEAMWLLSLPREEAARRWKEAPVQGILWPDAPTLQEYRKRLAEVLDGITAFYRMLPAQEGGEPKKE